jgi:hypothetical protein
MPPEAAREAEYDRFATATGTLLLVIARGAAMMIVRFVVPVFFGDAESEHPTANFHVPTFDGFPVIAPVDELSLRPGGITPDPIDQT